MALTRRCAVYTPRVGQIACIFMIGIFVGHYVVNDQQATEFINEANIIEKNYPHFKCVEISESNTIDTGDVREVSASLEDTQGQQEVVFEVISDLIASATKKPHNTQMSPGVIAPVGVSNIDLLAPGLVTNVVHYLWCEKKIFEFQHYLSVLSVVTFINPQRIIFHYGEYPRYDTQYYNTWFENMKKEFAYIDIDDLGIGTSICSSTESQKEYINKLLKANGGIYVHYNTIFTQFPIAMRQNAKTVALANGIKGFLVVHENTQDDSPGVRTDCVLPGSYEINNVNIICVIKTGPYYPRDAWNKPDDFSKLVNMLLYGRYTTPQAVSSNETIIPNIGHVFWVDGYPMNFLFYLNCLSQLYILKVDRLYIHGNKELSGEYWDKLKIEERVTFVKIIKTDLIFRNKIGIVNHMSDVFRGDVLQRYGGIYSDTDAIWLKPIPKHLLHYDVVASYDWPQMYSAYPDYINLGITLSKPGAPFWTYFLHQFKDFKDDMFGYNGLLKPYKIFERHPDLVYIYDKLQVMCWELRCHPTWYPDFRKKESDHSKYTDFNWKDAHAFHFTDPTPTELTNEEELKKSDTMFAQMGKLILDAAGKL